MAVPRTAAQVIGAATSALLAGDDVTDVLSRLIRDGVPLLRADAIGILVRVSDTELDLLTATTHRVADLELFQAQQLRGPCVDAIQDSAVVTCVGADVIVQRWPEVGTAMLRAGYEAVHAYPLRWHDTTLGAMNVFSRDRTDFGTDRHDLAGALADIAAVALTRAVELSADEVLLRIKGALESRAVIEQAKGVLAYRRRTDLATAYESLVGLADEAGIGILEAARREIEQARRD